MKIIGKAVDKQGEPIIGAAVLIEGTTVGTISDADGCFVLSADKDNVLSIQYIGMKTAKVKVEPEMKVVLEEG